MVKNKFLSQDPDRDPDNLSQRIEDRATATVLCVTVQKIKSIGEKVFESCIRTDRQTQMYYITLSHSSPEAMAKRKMVVEKKDMNSAQRPGSGLHDDGVE